MRLKNKLNTIENKAAFQQRLTGSAEESSP